MTKEINITLDRVSQLLTYNSETGNFTWKPRGQPKFDNRFAGKQAGVVCNGYINITIDYIVIRAHRLAYFMVNGKWPQENIDHINNDKLDNRIENLRLATTAQNMQNVGKYSTNTTGYKGVVKRKNGKPYEATIMAFGQYHYLGTYDTPEEAYAAYCKAAVDLHGEYHRLA